MKKVIIVQARMTSERLPGKVLKEVLGKPLLGYQIERLKRVNLANNLCIATTENDSDNPIVSLCQAEGISYYRGSENDVLARFYGAAVKNEADIAIRVTGDCPIIDPMIIDKAIDLFIKQYDVYDYLSNTLVRTYPRGMDVEVFKFEALEKSFHNALSQLEREHVTPHIYLHPEEFRLGNLIGSEDYSNYRWTVDTQDDFNLIKEIIESLYPDNTSFTMKDCLQLIKNRPELALINHHIEQKKLS